MKIELLSLKCNDTSNNEVNERLTSARNSLAHEYNEGYICDVINEVADSYTPIYYAEIFRAAYEVDEYITDGINEGIVYIDTEDFSLSKLIQQGYYFMIEQDLYSNFSEIMFNHCANYLNEDSAVKNIPDNSEKAKELINWLDDYYMTIDNNDRFDAINDALEEKIAEISDNEE